MAEKILNTRIALKIDTLENWGNSILPLKKGELALATVASSAGTGLTEPVVMIKVGEDGVKTFKDLEWNVYAKASDVLAACKSEAALKAFVNGVIADAGIATNEAMEALAGRVTTVENDLNTATTGLKAKMTAAEAAIDVLEGKFGFDTVALEIENALKNYSTTEQMNSAIATAKGEATSHADGLNTAMNTRVEKLEAIDHTHSFVESELNLIKAGDVAKWNAAEQNAKDHADGLNTTMDGRVQALEAKFGDGEGNVESQIAAAVAAEAKLREDADKALQDQIGVASAEGVTATGLHADIEAVEKLVGDTKVSEQIATAVAAEAEIARAAEKANADAITSLTDGAVKSNTEAIAKLNGDANTEGSVDYKVAQEVAKILNDNDATDIDTLEEIAAWIKNDTAGVGDLNRRVTDNTNAITKLNGDASTEGSVDKKIADAIAAENLSQYATDGDLSDLAGRVTTIETEHNTESTGLKARLTQAEADIDALETKVGDKTVSEQIEAAVEDAKTDASNKDAVVLAEAQKGIAAVQAVVDTKANDADLASVAKSGLIDDLSIGEGTVLIFDCGNASV